MPQNIFTCENLIKTIYNCVIIPILLIGIIHNFRFSHLYFSWPLECLGSDKFTAILLNCITTPIIIVIIINSIRYLKSNGKFWKLVIYHIVIMIIFILFHQLGFGLFLIEDKTQSFHYEDRYFDYPCRNTNLVYGHHTFGLGLLVSSIPLIIIGIVLILSRLPEILI